MLLKIKMVMVRVTILIVGMMKTTGITLTPCNAIAVILADKAVMSKAKKT